jgi:hypothetical protein
MRSPNIILLFLLLTFSSSANDTLSTFKKFSIGINISPELAYRRLIVNGTDPYLFYILAERENEIPLLGLTTGFDFTYFLKQNFAIQTGINFLRKGYKTHEFPFVDANGNIMGESEMRFNYYYLEIPFGIKARAGRKKVRFAVNAGISAGYLLSQINAFGNPGETRRSVNQATAFDRFNCFVYAAMGLDARLGKKAGLIIQPTCRFGLSQVMSAPISEQLWSVGLNTGFYYSF